MIRDIDFATYRALPGYGSSDLRAMRLGPPARVLWERNNPRKDTDATILGTAAHAAILTPAAFAASYVIKPDGLSFATKEGRVWRDDPARAGKVVLPFDVGITVASVRDAVLDKRAAREALEDAAGIEQSVEWTDETTGVPCKGRPDFYDDEAVYDLKVTRYAGPGLALAAYRNGWFHQLAHYRAGLRANGVAVRVGRIVAVQPEAPHYVWCVEVRDADLDVMALDNERTLGRIAECEATGEWPDTPDEWSRVQIPEYAIDSIVGSLDLDAAEEVK